MQQAKSVLIERAKSQGLAKPVFHTQATGPDHEPTFICEVSIDGKIYGEGQGNNKRDAERAASEDALSSMDNPQRLRQQTLLSEDFYEGPYPVIDDVLAACLTIANQRVPSHLHGLDAIEDVRELALYLYRGSLSGIGEVIEMDEDLLDEEED